MLEQNLSNKIMLLRKKAGLSQKQLGEYLGLTNRAISKWENGISMPSMSNIIKLAKIFGVSTDSFFSQEHENKSALCQVAGMESLTELYKVGRGPSSSHTMGPEKACIMFLSNNSDADRFRVTLFGSLAKTGRGHGTDTVIKKTMFPTPCDVVFNYSDPVEHPNTMILEAYKKGKLKDKITVFSVGGGKIIIENQPVDHISICYPVQTFEQINEECRKQGLRIWEYAMKYENESFFEYMSLMWQQMKTSILKGLDDEGILPGGLGVAKKAKALFCREHIDESPVTKENRLVCAYAFATSEQNASGEKIVTSPTCGAAGVLPAVLYYQQKKNGYSDNEIIRALITGGIIGNLVKSGASISGAECGCQAEIGTACAMAAAALGELFDLSIDKIEYAAEIAIEHHLGLTCDPIGGLVQIPCIERNAVAAMRAINAVNIASFLSDTRKISLDNVIKVMKETGRDLSCRYKETAEGGLAKIAIS